MKRKMLGELRINNVGENISSYGWVQKSRRMGSLIFVDVRDITGISQFVFKEGDKYFNEAEKLRSEYVVNLEGKVVERKSKNKEINTGDIEVECSFLKVLSTAKRLPMIIADETDALEAVRMKYRYLDLRRPIVKNNLLVRSKFNKITRDFFVDKGFIEIETPILTKPTPEGARDFIVPSRVSQGKFFSLPQSPQLYKQLLMISGFEKYFQIAKVFRDEDSRKDRQIEFTQLDVEMSFLKTEDIMNIFEEYIKIVIEKIIGKKISNAFPILKYDDAMNSYGSDRPDTRFDLLLNDGKKLFSTLDIDFLKKDIKQKKEIKYIKVDKKISGKEFKEIESFAKSHGANGIMFYSYDKKSDSYSGFLSKFLNEKIKNHFGNKNDYSILAISDEWLKACEIMGFVRNELANKYKLIDNSKLNFVWITEWPLFAVNEDGSLTSMHHPFTLPSEDTYKYISSDPKKVRSVAYDIVLNGSEIGGGSQRIYSKDMQVEIFKVLGLSEDEINEKFGFFVEAMDYGVPPHGGIAFGVDRIIQILTNANSIRDVIAFPKSTSGVAEMENAPSFAREELIDELNIIIKNNDKRK